MEDADFQEVPPSNAAISPPPVHQNVDKDEVVTDEVLKIPFVYWNIGVRHHWEQTSIAGVGAAVGAEGAPGVDGCAAAAIIADPCADS